MNTFFKVVLLVALIAGLSMFKPVQLKFNEVVNMGTVSGVARCVDLNVNTIISDEATKLGCAEIFQQQIFERYEFSGKASARPRHGEVLFTGSLENQTSTKVISWVGFTYTVLDSEGEDTEFHARTALWIEPNSSAEFELTLDGLKEEEFRDLPGCEENEVDCWYWKVDDLKGVSLN